MTAQTEFPLVFKKLRSILKPYASKFRITADTSNAYSLDGPFSRKWNKQVFFGAALIKKNYVSFHLMPVYMFPDLLKHISPELKKHMQGKSCFNFKRVDLHLFDELARLTQQGCDRFAREENS
jgi:hypothetical protein